MGSAGRLVGSPWIWKDGEFVRWEDAQVHVLSLAVQFAASVFEGVRCYETAKGPAVFRLDAHLKRLMASSRTYRMQPDHTVDELADAVSATIRRNDLRSCYIRPMVLRGYGASSMRPDLSPIETYIPVWPWGAYLGEEGLAKGVDVCVSSWNRPAPNTVPSGAKSAGNYLVSTLMVMEASSHGYAEAIGLGPSGLVSEGSGQNLFMVVDGEVVTPILDGTSLSGITRHSVLKISEELGYTVREQLVPQGDAVRSRRAVLHGDRVGGDADPVGRRAGGGDRTPGAGDRADSGALPAAGERRGAGSVGVADVLVGRGVSQPAMGAPRQLAWPAPAQISAFSASTPCSSTLAPRVMSSGAVYSSGAWLMPSRLGTKIMPTGPSSAMLWASCPAPDGMRMVE